ncbi:MAG TPA: MFS transporter [Gaiellaceae bacterium]|nr:MFS transporter [Gaiellaceae bacterium]
MAAASEPERWFLPGVRAIGAASLLSDLGHEVPTALLPSFLATTLDLGAARAAAALGVIEGVADGAAGVARFGGGPLADDPARRRRTAVGGYATTAVFSSAIGLATATWQVGVLRSVAWAARGARGPSRNALLADIAPPSAYGKAYGFERAMDNLGAIGGPLLALALVALVGVRGAILVSFVPGALAAVAIVAAVRLAPRLAERERRPLRLRVRPVLRSPLGGLLAGIAAFELANVAATLLILRTTDLLAPGESYSRTAVLLYAGYNLAATLVAVPAGHLADRRGPTVVLVLGAAAFAAAFAGFALAGASVPLLALLFVLAGLGIGVGETAQSAAVAAFAPPGLRGSAFGLVAALQAFANLAASAVAGLLWRAVSPEAAFLYLAAWAGLAAVVFAGAATRGRGGG